MYFQAVAAKQGLDDKSVSHNSKNTHCLIIQPGSCQTSLAG